MIKEPLPLGPVFLVYLFFHPLMKWRVVSHHTVVPSSSSETNLLKKKHRFFIYIGINSTEAGIQMSCPLSAMPILSCKLIFMDYFSCPFQSFWNLYICSSNIQLDATQQMHIEFYAYCS